MNELLKDLVFYFINHILNKIPSRKIRMLFYHYLSSKKISKLSTIGLGVKILDIRGVEIGDYSNINFECILDGRGGGICIGSNSDIAPQVNIWSLEHDPRDPGHSARGGRVNVGDGCWLANRVIVLPGVELGESVVVGAGSIVHGKYKACTLLVGSKAKDRGHTFDGSRERLSRIRKFR
jgi:maltose O-acetyltransferase